MMPIQLKLEILISAIVVLLCVIAYRLNSMVRHLEGTKNLLERNNDLNDRLLGKVEHLGDQLYMQLEEIKMDLDVIVHQGVR
jgi:hypothetical protein